MTKAIKNERHESYNLFTDPAEGWVEVPLAHLRQLNITDKISNDNSRMSAANAYLDEETDGALYFKAAKEAGWQVRLRAPNVHFDVAPMREFGTYNADFAKNPLRTNRKVLIKGVGEARILDVVKEEGAAAPYVSLPLLARQGKSGTWRSMMVNLETADKEIHTIPSINIADFLEESPELKRKYEASQRKEKKLKHDYKRKMSGPNM